ncbi:MAG: carbohydrate binding domain-containing protein, partial [Cyclobacteriaceae bacterium]
YVGLQSSDAYTYALSGDMLTVTGSGAFIGLSKAYNDGEYDGSDVALQTSVTYEVLSFNTTPGSEQVKITIAVGGGNYWTFTLAPQGEDTGGGGGGVDVGPSLIPNGGFEDGLEQTDWAFLSNNGTIEITDIDKNGGVFSAKLVADVPSTGTPAASNPIIQQEGFALDEVNIGDVVRVSFDVKASTSGNGGVPKAALLSNRATDAGATRYDINFSPTGDWQTVSEDITIDDLFVSANGLSIQFEAGCGGVNGCGVEMFVDNVSVSLVDDGGSDGQLLVNGDWETGGQAPWIANGAPALDIRTEGGNSFFFADIAVADPANPYNYGFQQNLTLEQGKNYRLTFDASTSAGNTRSIIAGIGLAGPTDFTNDTQTIILTDQTQTFTLNLSSNTFAATNGRAIFDLLGDVGIIVIDNISLIVLTALDDATLSDIKVNSESIDGFESAIADYSVELPFGTTDVPEVTVTTSADGSSTDIIVANGLPGTTTINVTSENGADSQTYSVSFTVALSDDATLADIKVDQETVDGFNTSTLEYEVELPFGTTVVPVVTAIAASTNTTVEVIATAELPGITTINVTAENGIDSQTYSVSFAVALSPDATLSDIKVGEETVDGFNASTLDYDVELPFGTTDVPVVTALQTFANATVEINAATSLPGITTIDVIAENGVDSQTYSVSLTVALSPDATLSDLKVGEETVDSFNAATFEYAIELPFGTTDVPVVTALQTFANATVEVNTATSLPGTTTVDVTAENGVDSQTYSVAFTVALSDDATLSDLKVGEETVNEFNAATLEYAIELPFGTTDVPMVSALQTFANATLEVNNATSLPGMTTIDVTAENGIDSQTYSVIFTFTPPPADVALNDLKVDGQTVDGFSVSMSEYTVELPFGTTIVPEVDAVAANTNTTVDIVASAELPGTTTINLTSLVGSNSATYSIAFTIAPPSDDASLSDIIVSEESIEGFNTSILEYSFELPFGTTEVPVISVVTTDANASVQMNTATSLPGSTMVMVTAQNGIDIQTYTISFTLAAPSEDASLSDIILYGQSIDNFNDSKLDYSFELPFGTTEVPMATAITTDANATVQMNTATTLPGTTSIDVTAENGIDSQTYTISYTVAAEISSDATLKSLKYNDTAVPEFSAEVMSYSIILPYKSELPIVTANPSNVAAIVTIDNISVFPGTATIVVTAQDGTTINTYEIGFSIEKFLISGIATDETGATFSSGSVSAVQLEDNSVTYTVELGANGEYEFPEIEGGTYIVGIDPIDSDKYYTTYFGNKILVEKAQRLLVTGDVSGVNIQMQLKPAEEDLLTGEATITGRVIEAVQGGGRIDFGRVLTGTPIAGVSVFLVRVVDGQVMTEVVTDENGDFTINGVPLGEYTLEFEIEGVQADLGDSTIVIDEVDAEIELTAAVSEDGVTIEIEDTVTAIDPEDLYELNAYSHNGVLYVNSNSELKSGRVELFTLSGIKILDRTLQNTQEQFLIKSSGVVVIRISDRFHNQVMSRKLFAD